MAEFGPHYRPVAPYNFESTPVEAGFTVADWGQIRPVGFVTQGSDSYLLAATERDPAIEQIPIDRVPGLHRTVSEIRSFPEDAVTRLSFQYYKKNEDGRRETGMRDVEIEPNAVSIGYGVLLPDHEGETPTWYLRASHVGFTTLTEGRLVPGPRIEQPQIKNFSLARIITGPLGDPCSDPEFRDRMGIAEIPE